PTICPESVANRKLAGLPLESRKEVELGLKTDPVGADGIETTSETMLPLPLYKVATSAPSSDSQNGLAGANAIPHGFTKCGSITAATPGRSESRLVWRYPMVSPIVCASVKRGKFSVSALPGAVCKILARVRSTLGVDDCRAITGLSERDRSDVPW